ncbi:preprotein translocase subunit SecA [bacterium]|nr:preprotein translocase subunit SecA [bacterium]
MLQKLLTKVVGSKNERELKRLQSYVEEINAFESEMAALTDEELLAKTEKFREHYRRQMDIFKKNEGIDEEYLSGLNRLDLDENIEMEKAEDKIIKAEKEILDELLPEAFAVVREAAKRVLNMRHFDVQLMGGIVLHEGKIAEMATGEGKTLVATLPVYLNSIAGKGVHVVTVNDYLAKRDSEWMGKVYKFLGLTVGLIQHDMDDEQRKIAYQSDVTYGTNNEFGFDYLRDNMKFDLNDYVQREHYYAIVDEVDSILIDEARTPLIISGPTEERDTDDYYKVDRIIPRLKEGRPPQGDEDKEEHEDYQVDEEKRAVFLTEQGRAKVERYLGIKDLYESEHDSEGVESAKYLPIIHKVEQALKAHRIFKRDVDYVVKDGEVIIVDEFTGRLMPGRRYSDGLHQALEAKEKVRIASENQTLASITFQNYFRLYKKLAGMTGTADTEAVEFRKIYNLDVVVIPTNRPLIRYNYSDVIYRTEDEKFKAVVGEIEECLKRGQPALVGTIAIEKSEKLHEMLKKKGIPHHVLNAKYHEKEAEIIAQAGQEGSVTISTNMAGRGTDIVLGTGIAAKGGLHVIGTERHESRRIDNQLRGRSGRQGDPGSSRFYLSLEDDLLKIFGAEMISRIMSGLGVDDGQPIEHRMITKAIERAQARVEGIHFEARKHLLEYDDVMNKQREVIYQQRRMVLEGRSVKDVVRDMIEDVLEDFVDNYTSPRTYAEDWDLKELKSSIARQFGFLIDFDPARLADMSQEGFKEDLHRTILNKYESREENIGSQTMRHLEKMIMLSTIDTLWKDHLYAMDHLKEGIGMRGYGRKEPLVEYKKEGFEMFQEMIHMIKQQTVAHLFMIQSVREEEEREKARRRKIEQQLEAAKSAGVIAPNQQRKKEDKVGRNEPCPCGSGKKYKKCCGA